MAAAERECRFVTTPAQTGGVTSDASGSGTPENGMRLFLELPDGRRTVVGAVVTRIFRRRDVNANEAAQAKDETSKTRPSFDEILVNPLDTMSPEEIHESVGDLPGSLAGWDREEAGRLRQCRPSLHSRQWLCPGWATRRGI